MYSFYTSMQIDLLTQFEILPLSFEDMDDALVLQRQIQHYFEDQTSKNTTHAFNSSDSLCTSVNRNSKSYMKTYMQERRKNPVLYKQEINADSTSLCLSLFLIVIFSLGNLFSTHSFCLISSHCLAFLFDSTSLCLSLFLIVIFIHDILLFKISLSYFLVSSDQTSKNTTHVFNSSNSLCTSVNRNSKSYMKTYNKKSTYTPQDLLYY
jgi:hypothetical protein